MADQIITDLQLIAALTDAVNVPCHDTIQTYRFTIAQLRDLLVGPQKVLLASLKDDIFHGLSAVQPQEADHLILADNSDANRTKKMLMSALARSGYRATSSYPVTVTEQDTTIALGGSAAGDVNLPANGLPGKRYRFLNNTSTAFGAAPTPFTFVTQGGATIGGVASGAFGLFLGPVLIARNATLNMISFLCRSTVSARSSASSRKRLMQITPTT